MKTWGVVSYEKVCNLCQKIYRKMFVVLLDTLYKKVEVFIIKNYIVIYALIF